MPPTYKVTSVLDGSAFFFAYTFCHTPSSFPSLQVTTAHCQECSKAEVPSRRAWCHIHKTTRYASVYLHLKHCSGCKRSRLHSLTYHTPTCNSFLSGILGWSAAGLRPCWATQSCCCVDSNSLRVGGVAETVGLRCLAQTRHSVMSKLLQQVCRSQGVTLRCCPLQPQSCSLASLPGAFLSNRIA